MKKYIIGIDTSNYTTSLAACSLSGQLIFDMRIMLSVKSGERGLRQQEALFQHMQNVPVLVDKLLEKLKNDDGWQIAGIAASDRPRPQKGSYMPVFLSGVNYATVMSKTADVPLYRFSHQEGHIEAVLDEQPHYPFLVFHLSGGTTELLHVGNAGAGYDIDVIGGSLDISVGQLIDRIGVALGLQFPCGVEMDKIAWDIKERKGKGQDFADIKTESDSRANFLGIKPINIKGTWMNLSGIETQCLRMIADGCEKELLIYELFYQIKNAVEKIVENAYKMTEINNVLMAGGVSESKFMDFNSSCKMKKAVCSNSSETKNCGSDNAVGTALLGLRQWQLDNQ